MKKAHYHITLLYPSVQNKDKIKEFVVNVLKCPIPISCQSVKGSIRYMVHKDNPDKHQYNWNDIKCHGGADLDALCAPTMSEKQIILKEISAFIRDKDIFELRDLDAYALENGLNDWYYVMTSTHTLYVKSLISSNRHRRIK